MPHSTSTRLPHHYAVYGLALASNEEIPGLHAEKIPRRRRVDIRIHLGSIPGEHHQYIARHGTVYFVEPAGEEGGPPHLVVNSAANGRYYHFAYAEGVEFLLDTHDRAVWCGWRSNLPLQIAALYLLGPILGFLLRLRGTTCLHASGVVVNGDALAITGFSGAGKSTLAAAFAAAGFAIMTDDILPLVAVDGKIYAQPGYGRLRLFPSSFRSLAGLPDELPVLAPDWDKCYLDLAANNFRQHRAPAALKAVYILDWSAGERLTTSITPVPAATAVAALAAHTYRNELLSEAMRMQEFYFLSAVASNVVIRKLCPVDDMSAIALLRDRLLEDFVRVDARRQPRTMEWAAGNPAR